MPELLVVDCKFCGHTWPSPIQMDRTSFESSTVHSNTFQCPSCGKSSTYGKANLRFVDE